MPWRINDDITPAFENDYRIVLFDLEEHTYLLDQRLSELRTIGEDLIQFGKLMSHDVQDPIRKIAVYTDRIANKYNRELDEDVVTQFRIIHQQCAKFRSVTANLEQFISLNLHTVQFEEINLNYARERLA